MAGSSVSSVAVPYLAVVELNASTAHVSALVFLTQLPSLLVTLHAGALADRHPKRPLMIGGDLVCVVVLLTLPLAAALDRLTFQQLVAVAFVQATAGVVHDAAAIAYLPTLLDRSLLQQGNSRIGGLFSLSATAGSSLGAVLVSVLGAARVLLADALSYAVSAWCTTRIRVSEAPPSPRTGNTKLRPEIAEGVRYVFADTTLRTLTLTNSAVSFALGVLNTVWALYLLRELRFTATAFGLVMGAATLGSCAGALLAPRMTRWYGPGPMMLAALALTPLTQIPLLIASPGRSWQIAIGAALAVQLFCAAAAGTTQRSIRQMITTPRLQGRMQAVNSWLTGGSRPFAAPLAGAIGTLHGVRSALIVGTVLLLVPVAVLALSPVRSLRALPVPTLDPGGDSPTRADVPAPANEGAPLTKEGDRP
ncbi:MFS transporter [Streptomyces sp. NBC_00124]|uniref:MFS transporter n=1 Tax=Streptomyces sp. NBC_00124 TaxID=2975662 RepID=UPI00224F616D|nr:MFS transporter [Streptomyces sp. NBC_00124]MCX5357800.1 MFS transporter [Streptomyces sp. NBC_00124]